MLQKQRSRDLPPVDVPFGPLPGGRCDILVAGRSLAVAPSQPQGRKEKLHSILLDIVVLYPIISTKCPSVYPASDVKKRRKAITLETKLKNYLPAQRWPASGGHLMGARSFPVHSLNHLGG